MIRKYGVTLVMAAVAFGAGMVVNHEIRVQAQGNQIYELRTYTQVGRSWGCPTRRQPASVRAGWHTPRIQSRR